MRWKIRLIKASIVVLPVLILLVLFQVVLPQIRKWHRHGQFDHKMQEWHTEHFRFYCRKFDKQKEVGAEVEKFYRVFMSTFGKQLGTNPFDQVKPEITIFGDRDEFLSYNEKRYREKMEHSAAYYDSKDYTITLYWSKKVKPVLYHELVHLFLDLGYSRFKPQWSLWLNEGLASYIERCTLEEELKPMPVDTKTILYLKDNYLPISEILSASAREFYGKNSKQYYLQSYFLIYFLLHGKDQQYREKFYRYFYQESKTGPCRSNVFWDIMELSPPSQKKSRLYQESLQYLQSLKLSK